MTFIPSSVKNLSDDVLQKYREIVKLPLKFDDEEEESLARKAVEKLSEEELEACANIFYSYWSLKLLGDDCITPEVTKKLATKITSWHVQFLGSKDVEKIAKRVKNMVKLRKEHNIQKYRTIFDKESTSEFDEKVRKAVLAECERQVNIFVGKDKIGRAMFYTGPRCGEGFEFLEFAMTQVFYSEKMIAVNEYLSNGEFDKVCGVIEHEGATNVPPTTGNRNTMGFLQQLYPARVGKAIVMNASFLVRQFFGLIKPLLPKATQNATVLVAGSNITTHLKEVLPDTEIINMEGKFLKEVDMVKYVTETAFYKPYEF